MALYSFAMNKGRKLYFSNSTPFALRALPLYSLTETQGERRVNSITPTSGIFNPSPRRYAPQFSPIFSCTTPRNASGHGRGRRLNTNDFLSQSKKVLVTLIRFICSFFSAARRTNQEAPPRLSGFWLVATVAVGVCGTRFARTVLAHFSSVSLATSPPDKGGIGGLACILTPSPCGHSPYIPCRNTGEKGNTRFGNEVELYCFVTPRHVTGHGRGGLNA